jgi:hypothetical protein
MIILTTNRRCGKERCLHKSYPIIVIQQRRGRNTADLCLSSSLFLVEAPIVSVPSANPSISFPNSRSLLHNSGPPPPIGVGKNSTPGQSTFSVGSSTPTRKGHYLQCPRHFLPPQTWRNLNCEYEQCKSFSSAYIADARHGKPCLDFPLPRKKSTTLETQTHDGESVDDRLGTSPISPTAVNRNGNPDRNINVDTKFGSVWRGCEFLFSMCCCGPC